MSLRDRITEDMKSAMRAKETARLSAIRLLLAAIKQREVDERIVLDDAAGRKDLAGAERFEADLLTAYLPERSSPAELAAAIDQAVRDTGAKSPADMGKVMGIVKLKLAGRADMGEVSRLIKIKLSA